MEDLPPVYTNPPFARYRKPLPEQVIKVLPHESGRKVRKFVDNYVNPIVFGCVCGKYWIRSAGCDHWTHNSTYIAG